MKVKNTAIQIKDWEIMIYIKCLSYQINYSSYQNLYLKYTEHLKLSKNYSESGQNIWTVNLWKSIYIWQTHKICSTLLAIMKI